VSGKRSGESGKSVRRSKTQTHGPAIRPSSRPSDLKCSRLIAGVFVSSHLLQERVVFDIPAQLIAISHARLFQHKEGAEAMHIARLWIRNGSEWEQRPLDDAVFCFSGAGPVAPEAAPSDPRVWLVLSDSGVPPSWALVASPDAHVQVNGRAPVAGLRVLNDRDMIRTANGARYVFCSESRAVIEPFRAADRTVFCGRCRQRLDGGSPAVCCPGCGIWYHQGADLPCWTYSEQCVYCHRATAFDAGYSWTPED